MSPRLSSVARFICVGIVCLGLLAPGGSSLRATPAEDEDALFRQWLSAFAELKRGEAAAEEEHWPNAIARYRSSLVEFEGLAADYPDYQSEIVQYRIGDLAGRIEAAQQTLQEQFAETAASYDRAIGQIVKAENLEQAGLSEEAYRVIARAIYQLKKLTIHHPEFYADSLSDTLGRAEEISGRLRTLLLALTDGKVLLAVIEEELAEELPELDESGLPSRPDVMMSADLFPSTSVGDRTAGNG